ncbi:hypothetical protein AMECASPLE_003779 [Ameca splendens]|uniref:Uncharacterized protein n=1 Tax=Ameca splendens TaxID=208324 RepID=A0ABV0ZUI2_9TELE
MNVLKKGCPSSPLEPLMCGKMKACDKNPTLIHTYMLQCSHSYCTDSQKQVQRRQATAARPHIDVQSPVDGRRSHLSPYFHTICLPGHCVSKLTAHKIHWHL